MKTLVRSVAVLAPLTLVLATALPAAAADREPYPYDQPGDRQHISNTNVLERYSPDAGDNRSIKITSPRARADATFTANPITVDGVREPAWDAATAYPIDHRFAATMTADAPDATTTGTVRLLWDGPVLYALVEVSGDASQADTGTPAWRTASYAPETDGLFVSMDVFNDQWGLETDTQGVFFLGADPQAPGVTSFVNPGIPSLGSFFNPAHQDYSSRLTSARSSGYSAGSGVNYTYEIALQTEGWGDAAGHPADNGREIGLEFGVYDQGHSFTYWSKSQYDAGREGSSNLPNSERVRNRDWGVVTLAGRDAGQRPAYSGWAADEDIRFWDSKSNPGGSGNGTGAQDDGDDSRVWTPESADRMIAAKHAYLAIRDDASATRAAKEAAVREVTDAFQGLRWADTRYPDPHDLPSTQTLPSAFAFFDPAKGTDGLVTTPAEWEDRKAEILDLAQFYEYGDKPLLGEDYTVEIIANTYAGSGNPSVTARIVPTNARFVGGAPVTVTIPVTLPASVPGGMKAAVAFGGGFTANGIANVPFPTWGSDNRTDTGAWGAPNRTGTFYTLFPYQRNSTAADSSILIANATAVSAYLDVLELAAAQNPALAAKIDPTRAVTKGFSIGGKNAFVAAVFDERVKAVVAGGAGATGPANWRYNAQGQEYDFTGTAYDAPGAEDVVAHGTEGPGNSYRHNRVRETELFRHFMPYGHMYAHEDGAYSYGSYDQLPFDQSLLVATLAPERAILIDTNLNDYNDGSTTDNMSLQIAKSVYENLGVDADGLVRFNSGAYTSSGDPHGTAPADVEGRYLSDLLYGTATQTDADRAFLSTDPYALPVSDDRTQSPYDYYWGGYNTITGGAAGVAGSDGWYFGGFDAEVQGLRQQVGDADLGTGRTNALTRKLEQAASQLAKHQPQSAAGVLGGFVQQVDDLAGDEVLDPALAHTLTADAQQLALYLRSIG